MTLAWETQHLCISSLFSHHTKDVSTQWQQHVWCTKGHGREHLKSKNLRRIRNWAGNTWPGRMRKDKLIEKTFQCKESTSRVPNSRRKNKDGKPPQTVPGNGSYKVLCNSFSIRTKGQPFLSQRATPGHWTNCKWDYRASPEREMGPGPGPLSLGTNSGQTM